MKFWKKLDAYFPLDSFRCM